MWFRGHWHRLLKRKATSAEVQGCRNRECTVSSSRVQLFLPAGPVAGRGPEVLSFHGKTASGHCSHSDLALELAPCSGAAGFFTQGPQSQQVLSRKHHWGGMRAWSGRVKCGISQEGKSAPLELSRCTLLQSTLYKGRGNKVESRFGSRNRMSSDALNQDLLWGYRCRARTLLPISLLFQSIPDLPESHEFCQGVETPMIRNTQRHLVALLQYQYRSGSGHLSSKAQYSEAPPHTRHTHRAATSLPPLALGWVWGVMLPCNRGAGAGLREMQLGKWISQVWPQVYRPAGAVAIVQPGFSCRQPPLGHSSRTQQSKPVHAVNHSAARSLIQSMASIQSWSLCQRKTELATCTLYKDYRTREKQKQGDI